MIINKSKAVSPSILNSRANGWRGMIRIESTGGDVDYISKCLDHYLPAKKVFAEGDSWFDKFTPIPLIGTNLLDAIRTPFNTAVVDVSNVGDEASEMVGGRQARQTKAIFDIHAFDAILLSAGGNDLKNMFVNVFSAQSAGAEGQKLTQAEQVGLADPKRYHTAFKDIISYIRTFISFRDGSRFNKASPIFMNGYDYFQPRPSGAIVFAGTRLGGGPWLYGVMKQAGLDGAQMRAAADAVIDEINRQLADLCNEFENVYLIDQRTLLKPAHATATGPDGDWMDEIHPNEQGFVKLARNRWDVPLSTALGWTPSNADLVAAAGPVNASTARPT